MHIRKVLLVGASLSIFALAPITAFAEPFDWIMSSISAQGKISYGDGHRWEFRSKSGGWEVVGKGGATADVTSGGDDVVTLSGFPRKWGANGDYAFSNTNGECALTAKRSGHSLKWDC